MFLPCPPLQPSIPHGSFKIEGVEGRNKCCCLTVTILPIRWRVEKKAALKKVTDCKAH